MHFLFLCNIKNNSFTRFPLTSMVCFFTNIEQMGLQHFFKYIILCSMEERESRGGANAGRIFIFGCIISVNMIIHNDLFLTVFQIIFRSIGLGSGIVDPYSPEALSRLTVTNLRIQLLQSQQCPSQKATEVSQNSQTHPFYPQFTAGR